MPMRTSVEKWLYRLAVLVALSELALVVGSWLVASAEPDLAMRSLLSPSGVRWYFGNYVDRIATPLLVYIILCAVAWGCMRQSKLMSVLITYLSPRRRQLTTHQMFALCTSVVVLALEVATLAVLTLLPHAILLSVTGSLWPSSFSRSVVPAVAFMLASTNVVFAVSSGQIRSVTQLGRMITSEAPVLLPLLLLYCLAADFAGCLRYVFG